MDIISEFENGDVIACIDGNDKPLYTAAPDLLSALEDCISAYNNHKDNQPTGHLWPDPNHIYRARAAIAKVKGN